MSYFEDLAGQAFKKAPDGRQLFYRGGPLSRPYIVPDFETGQRLLAKQLRLMKILFGFIFGQSLLFALVPNLLHKPLWLAGYAAIALTAFLITGNLLFRDELATLARVESRLPLHDYFAGLAAKHSKEDLTIRLVACAAFVLMGYWMVAYGGNKWIGWACSAFFGVCAVGYAYTLLIKWRTP